MKVVSLNWIAYTQIHKLSNINQIQYTNKIRDVYLLALDGGVFTFVRTIEKFSIEQLNTNNSKNKLEQYIHD